jgi:hypothetical protein
MNRTSQTNAVDHNSTQAVSSAGALFSDWTRRAGAWLQTMAMDDRSRHVASAQDHDDLVRRERDCAAFERRCAALPLLH